MLHLIKRRIAQSISRQMQEVEHTEVEAQDKPCKIIAHNSYALHGSEVASIHRHWINEAKKLYKKINN